MPFRRISELRKTCNHPEHNPPKHICLPPGLYEYECPGCKQITLVRQDVVIHHAEESLSYRCSGDDAPISRMRTS